MKGARRVPKGRGFIYSLKQSGLRGSYQAFMISSEVHAPSIFIQPVIGTSWHHQYRHQCSTNHHHNLNDIVTPIHSFKLKNMKKLILLSVAIAAFITSCTKTKYVNVTSPADTVTTIQTDTVVKIDSGLLGKWKSVSLGYSNWNLRFANDSLTIAGEAEPYLASSDTIYAKFTSVTISYWFEYRLSPDGDTLTLNNPTSGEFNIKFYKVY